MVIAADFRHLRHFIGGIRDAEHDTTQLATLFYGEAVIALNVGQHRFSAIKRVDGVRRMAVKLNGSLGFRGQLFSVACHFQQQIWALLEEGFHVVDRIAGTRDFVAGSVHIDYETCWSDANQDQHDQTNAFLTVVGAVGECHANGGENQSDTRPERRLFLTVFLFTFSRGQVDTGAFFGSAPVTAQQENQTTRNNQTHDRRDNQRTENVNHFRDVERLNH